MAATRLIAMHHLKGKSLAACLKERVDYAMNPEKTEKGIFIRSYECDPMTVDKEFLLSKQKYHQISGLVQSNDVIAYQIRQSFKPGEITAEEANRVGYELAMRFTKGKHAFIVATHTDKEHIHNHIIYNSTNLDCSHKFKNFSYSARALQRLSDLICLEHGLSVISPKPYHKRNTYTDYEKKVSFRDAIRDDIDQILKTNPKNMEEFLKSLEENGYQVKIGKYIALKKGRQKRYIRMKSLGIGYSEEEIKNYFTGTTHDKKKFMENHKLKIGLLIDIEMKLQKKGPGYYRWASVYNLKQMAKTLVFLREHNIDDLDALANKTDEVISKKDCLLTTVKEEEKKLKEIAVLKKHIINYSKTKEIYHEYQKFGYEKQFYEEHRFEIEIHKAAKRAFDERKEKKIPKVKVLNDHYKQILAKKKKDYEEYQKVKQEMQEWLIAQKNIEQFLECEQREHEQKIQKQER
ncbi:MAG: relaxase/mobilization nuclease domain-containing protein [Lachnospiraceae bacterium]|nr:relaxase/mobilization nuclease domain-containing protein [Lachnospiraceae bacterium]